MTKAFRYASTNNDSLPKEAVISFLAGLKLAAMAPAAPAAEEAVISSAEEAALYIGSLISHEFKMHQWYTYYAELLKGVARTGLVELFEELAPLELEDARYFLRRLSVLSPGAVIPPVPSPAPETDPLRAAAIMLVEEQRAITLLSRLRELVEGDPMQYQVEGMIAEEQTHADRLRQYTAAKVAALALPASDEVAAQLNAQRAHLATAENGALRQQVTALTAAVQQHMQAAESAGAQAELAGEQAAQAQEQAAGSMQEAQQHAQAAATEADAKARLAIRIQQIRQQLADLVTQDPVAEEGEAAAPLSTPTQESAALPVSEEEIAPPPAPKTAGTLPEKPGLMERPEARAQAKDRPYAADVAALAAAPIGLHVLAEHGPRAGIAGALLAGGVGAAMGSRFSRNRQALTPEQEAVFRERRQEGGMRSAMGGVLGMNMGHSVGRLVGQPIPGAALGAAAGALFGGMGARAARQLAERQQQDAPKLAAEAVLSEMKERARGAAKTNGRTTGMLLGGAVGRLASSKKTLGTLAGAALGATAGGTLANARFRARDSADDLRRAKNVAWKAGKE